MAPSSPAPPTAKSAVGQLEQLRHGSADFRHQDKEDRDAEQGVDNHKHLKILFSNK